MHNHFNLSITYFHGQLEALFDIKKFRQGDQHFIETYLYIFGSSLRSKDTNVKNKKVEFYFLLKMNKRL